MSLVPTKSDNSSKSSDNYPNSGVIRFEVENISALNEDSRYSHEIEVGGLPWVLQVRQKEESGEGCFAAFLYSMEHESKQWSIDVHSEYILFNSDNSKNYTQSDTDTYNHECSSWGYTIIPFTELIGEEKGFIRDNKIIIEVRFSILKMKGIWINPRFDNSSSGENRSQIVILMEGNTMLVDKHAISPSKTRNAEAAGMISFETRICDIGTNVKYSPEIEVHGTIWRLSILKQTNSRYLGVYLDHARSESNIWSVDVSADFSLINYAHNEDPLTERMDDRRFDHDAYSWGYSKFVLWDDLINEEKGFVKDGKITINAHFTLYNIVGIRTIPRIDFADLNDPRHDVTLVIEGEKVHVGKQMLAFHSPVFNAMFYGNHIEKDKKEIELKEIDRKVFIEMLNLIYPSYQKIIDSNAESLLKMADYFQINLVIDKVEQYLIDSINWDIPAKLKLSDQYRLVKLQDYCLDSFKAVMDVMNLQTFDVYKSLSNELKLALLDKSMKLSRIN